MKTPGQSEDQPSAPEQGHSKPAASFLGTSNPRHLRALQALRTRPQPREALDVRAGCSNGPALVADLRALGLDLPCERTPCIDRDGFEVKRGIYNLTERDRRKLIAWLARRDQKGQR
jgi:hypothetical protein